MQSLAQVLANPLYFKGVRTLPDLPTQVWAVSSDSSVYATPDTTTIQAAIDAAAAGDTILVFPGTYKELLNIDKPLTIYGNGAYVHPQSPGRPGGESTIQPTDAAGNVALVSITQDQVHISGFELTGFYTGIQIPGNAFQAPDYLRSHITLSYLWIHGEQVWTGIQANGGNLQDLEISDSILDVDQSSSTGRPYALSGISFSSGGTVNPHYTNITIRNNVLRNSSGFYNIYCGADPVIYRFTNFIIECNHFLCRSRAALEPGFNFNVGNIQNGRFESNVVEDNSGLLGISGGTIQGNSFLHGGALKIWGTEYQFPIPSANLTIQNNEFTNEISGTGIQIRQGAQADTITSHYNSFADAHIPSASVLNAVYGYLIRNDGTGTHDATQNWWGTPNGAEGNTGDLYGAIRTKPCLTQFQEEPSSGHCHCSPAHPLCWPLSSFRRKRPGFYPRIITDVTYIGRTCFEPDELVELEALVQFTGGTGADIPVTFLLCGKEYATKTRVGGVAKVSPGKLCRGCYRVKVCVDQKEVCTFLHVQCQCPVHP